MILQRQETAFSVPPKVTLAEFFYAASKFYNYVNETHLLYILGIGDRNARQPCTQT